jgi:polysaccharide deacetylase 2 family uncharacterized protein YibQ
MVKTLSVIGQVIWLYLTSSLLFSYAAVTIIIDDMGNTPINKGLLALPPAITFSILPNTPYAQQIAVQSLQQKREIMLHMPMQSVHDKAMGPLGLNQQQSNQEIQQTIQQAIDSVPGVSGVNNHMGSLLTTQEVPMNAVMEILKQQQLYFIDSRTTVATIAADIAQRYQIPNMSRDIFLDNKSDTQYLNQQLQHALAIAKQKKQVTIIAHPYPTTIKFLHQHLAAALERENQSLTTPSEQFKLKSVAPNQ